MPRTVARLRQIEEYASQRWYATNCQCGLWCKGWYEAYCILNDSQDDARYVIQEET